MPHVARTPTRLETPPVSVTPHGPATDACGPCLGQCAGRQGPAQEACQVKCEDDGCAAAYRMCLQHSVCVAVFVNPERTYGTPHTLRPAPCPRRQARAYPNSQPQPQPHVANPKPRPTPDPKPTPTPTRTPLARHAQDVGAGRAGDRGGAERGGVAAAAAAAARAQVARQAPGLAPARDAARGRRARPAARAPDGPPRPRARERTVLAATARGTGARILYDVVGWYLSRTSASGQLRPLLPSPSAVSDVYRVVTHAQGRPHIKRRRRPC